MGVMMLAAEFGANIHISIQGKDEQQAFEALKKLFEDKFNEEF